MQKQKGKTKPNNENATRVCHVRVMTAARGEGTIAPVPADGRADVSAVQTRVTPCVWVREAHPPNPLSGGPGELVIPKSYYSGPSLLL